ncbi:MAG: hypothetical protein ACFFD1_07795 [Candidatus Thorarchaeota archaeon]
MNENLNHKMLQLRLWEYLDKKLIESKSAVLQNDLIKYAEESNLCSRKTVLTILNEFVEAKMIDEIELPPEGPGRPKKAYNRTKGKDESVIVNISKFPSILYTYITNQAEKNKLGKGEIITQLVTWAFLQLYEDTQFIEHAGIPVPKHLNPPTLPHDIR